jgi:aldehyde:ferredoxin oxidoreductase
VLPKKLLTPAPDGARQGKAPPFDDMLRECYRIRGWTPEGYPTLEMLESVGLESSLYEDHVDLATMKEVIK